MGLYDPMREGQTQVTDSYRDALSKKAPPSTFEAPLAEKPPEEGKAPEMPAPTMDIQRVDTYVPDPEKDHTFEDLKKTYYYTIKPNGDIYFSNKKTGKNGLIPADANTERAVKARAAILKMKEKAPRNMPDNPHKMQSVDWNTGADASAFMTAADK